jgi:hypothetical protein
MNTTANPTVRTTPRRYLQRVLVFGTIFVADVIWHKGHLFSGLGEGIIFGLIFLGFICWGKGRPFWFYLGILVGIVLAIIIARSGGY